VLSDQFVLVLTTFPAEGDASAFARTLVDEKLAACVSVLQPMQSTYRWKGEIEQTDERQILIKTTAVNVDVLQLRVKALHPYNTPEFLVFSVNSGSPDYLSWLAGETRP
jgi:periplasmic divalent cation tolerance protein